MVPTRPPGILWTACTPFWTPTLGKPFPLEDAMRFLELLRIFRVIADLPDFADREATRTWLLGLCDVAKLLTDRTPTLGLCDVAKLLTDRTPTPADDAVLAFLKRSVADEKLFDPIFELLTNLLAAEPGAPTCAAPPELAAATEAAAIDPLTIVAIMEAVVALIKFIRERRGK